MERVEGVPTLFQLALAAASKMLGSLRFVSSYDLIKVHALIRAQLFCPELEQVTRSRIRQSFDGLRTLVGDVALTAALGTETYAAMLDESTRCASEAAKLRQVGVVLEPATPPVGFAALHTSPTLENGRVCYPYALLRRGANWPEGVHPNRREDFLTDASFLEVLRISRSDFGRLPGWKQRQIKCDADLF